MKLLRRAALTASLLVLAACSTTGGGGRSAATAPALGPWGFDLAAIDTSVKPGDDFYRFASGNWLKTTKIPGDRTSWGSFQILADKSELDVRDSLLRNAAASHADGTIEQQVADYDASYEDVGAIEAKGVAPAKPDLDRIAAARTHDDIAAIMAEPGMPGGPVGISPGIDAKHPDAYDIDVSQGGLGLPDRDYYLRDDKQFKDVRRAYQAYIAQLLTLARYPDPSKAAAAILKLETAIARASWEVAKRRDRDLTYNPMNRAQLIAFAPGFPWQRQLDEVKLSNFDRFNVNETTAIQKLSADFTKTPVAVWRAYLTFHYLNAYADVLPKAYDDASFNFEKVLSGRPSQRERWKRSIASMDAVMGQAVGQLYVRDHFSPEAKAAMIDLVENLRAAFAKRIEGLEWMSPETKKEALDKLALFGVKIGYPDRWKDFSTLKIVKGDALGNAKRLSVFEWERNIARIDRPVDKTEWLLAPQTINAYYMPSFNEIVFPAAILQSPFFDPAADSAINYGGIGAVIGHEMSHGFDDQGSKVDGRGVQRDWWSAQDRARFVERTKRLGAQYARFELLKGIFVNGDLTMGENIGDLGGVTVAHEAYEISLEGKTPDVKDGFSGEQRFFLGWAQVWRTLMRDETLRNQILSNPHSPAEARVNGVVRNVDAWYDAYKVEPGAKLYLAPDQRVHIW